MKRSTIVLLIVLAVMIFAPIIAIKVISNLSPETKLKSLKELLDYNENANAPVRYLVIDDTDNDSVYSCICIFISTRDKKDSRKGIVFANGENYTGDTLHLTDQWLEQPSADDSNDSIPQSWFGKQTLDYDHNTTTPTSRSISRRATSINSSFNRKATWSCGNRTWACSSCRTA